LIHGSGSFAGTISYLSNYIGTSPSFLIYPLDSEPTLILHFYNHIPGTRAMSVVSDVQWHYNDPSKCVVENLEKKKLDKARLGVVGLGTIPYSQFVKIKEKLPDATLMDVSKEYNWIRWVRSEEELDWFRESARLSDLTMEALEKKIRPGLTLHDLNAIVHEAFLKEGGQLWIAYLASTSMANPDVFVPWQVSTFKKVNRGDVVITEITIGYHGYNAQIHRPFAVAAEPTPLYKKLFDTALTCFEDVSKALKDGSTSEDVLNATSVIEENGFTIYDSLVHGEGAKNPELGSRSSVHPKEPFVFRENMVCVIQPQPITLDHKAGLQLGAAVVVTKNGAKNLHSYPLKFQVCGL
ncbi:MAG: M24 family metallopeptidase, partial [Nitrososphaerales archaeon]